jgi:hypothetical protein
MNKFKKTYNHQIDQFIKSASDDFVTFDVKKSEINNFLNLKRAIQKIASDENKVKEIISYAWENKDIVSKLKNENDFYFYITSVLIAKNSMKKVAYPMSENYFFKNPFYGYNLQSWATCVHKIYESVYNEGADYSDSVKKYSSNTFKDDEEKKNFLSWLNYYNHGEHLKYNVKNASFNFGLPAGGGLYKEDYIGSDFVLDHDHQVNNAKERGEAKLNYSNWKKKFNTALRRVDKILKESEEYVDPEKYEEISQILNKLDVQVAKIRLQASASDISYRAASQLTKLGFDKGASILFKYAQEATPPEAVAPEQAQEATPPQEPADVAPEGEGEPVKSESEIQRKQQDKENVEKGKEALKGIEPLPGPKEDEYKEIMNKNVSVDDASRKLEQIAGTLSDRRVIRYLAEFDIMLDKVGIASMFPELAEAQSKLIESYSYALTRVTKMLGMLSNNKAIMEMTMNKRNEDSETPAGQNATQNVTPEAQPAPEIQPAPEAEIE